MCVRCLPESMPHITVEGTSLHGLKLYERCSAIKTFMFFDACVCACVVADICTCRVTNSLFVLSAGDS